MKLLPRHRRLGLLLLILAVLALAAFLTLQGLRQQVTYFYTPSEIQAQRAALLAADRAVRLGGLVVKGSIEKTPPQEVAFTVTDLAQELRVAYSGLLPDLFRDGQGVVAEGRLQPDGSFRATLLLAKHDENYMPPEVAKGLARQGHPMGPPVAQPGK